MDDHTQGLCRIDFARSQAIDQLRQVEYPNRLRALIITVRGSNLPYFVESSSAKTFGGP